jgi:hypothetical protein
MIDAKLLNTFLSDIEWMKATSASSANSSASPLGANSTSYDPFEEVLARAMGDLGASQATGNMSPTELLNSLQLVRDSVLDTWLKPVKTENGTTGKAVTSQDIDNLFPELANLDKMLG